MKKSILKKVEIIVIFTILVIIGLFIWDKNSHKENLYEISYSIGNIPKYNGKDYIEINENEPNFSEQDMQNDEYYSELQNERVGVCMIKASWDKAKKDEIKDDFSEIKPTGYKQKKYDEKIVPDGFIYHRCHIIAWMLGGRDVDEKNIMTGTQNFNMNGMKQFENKVYEYIRKNKSNHVLYRVTPYFEGENRLATGVNMEAFSLEDNGKLKFNVFVYNVQDGIIIDYLTGKNKLAE